MQTYPADLGNVLIGDLDTCEEVVLLFKLSINYYYDKEDIH